MAVVSGAPLRLGLVAGCVACGSRRVVSGVTSGPQHPFRRPILAGQGLPGGTLSGQLMPSR